MSRSSELFLAIESGNAARVSELLRMGADANARSHSWPYCYPLHLAIEVEQARDQLGILRDLLAYGADIDAWDAERIATPLITAVAERHPDAVALLLAHGASPNVRSALGVSPLSLSVELGEASIAALLLRAGATETIDRYAGTFSRTPLGVAARHLDLPMMELLLDAGADPLARDAHGRTAAELLPEAHEGDPERLARARALLVR